MRNIKKIIRDFGYSEFFPMKIEGKVVNIYEAALKEKEPFVAIGRKIGRGKMPEMLELPGLAMSIQYIAVENGDKDFYKRTGDHSFSQCLTIPKADGTVWGRHSKEDLIPLSNVNDVIHYAQDLTKSLPRAGSAMAFLLAFKLMDEASGKEILFRISEEELDVIEDWLTTIARSFGLEKEWKEVPLLDKELIQKAVMAWQPYSFLPSIKNQGIFSSLSILLNQMETGGFFIPESIVRLILALLAGCKEPICICGPGSPSLCDIAHFGAKAMEIVGEFPPIIEKIIDTLFHGTRRTDTDFLAIDNKRQLETMVCIPPFGKRIVDEDTLSRFDLVDRGRGKCSRATDAQILWIEKAQRHLSENGLLVILLSEGFLSNASYSSAREWVKGHFMIDSVFSLPSAIFNPASNIKTSLVCLRKMAAPPDDYKIFMAEIEQDDLNDISGIIQEYRLAKQGNAS